MGIKKVQKTGKVDTSLHEKLFEIGKQLLVQSTVDELLEIAIDKTIELSSAQRGMIILFGKGEEILFQAARNIKKEDINHPKFEVSRTIIKNVQNNIRFNIIHISTFYFFEWKNINFTGD